MHDQLGHVDAQRDELQRRDLLFDEDELRVGPRRQLADLVLGFRAHGVVKLVLGQRAEDDQDAAEGELRLALDVERLLPLLLGDHSAAMSRCARKRAGSFEEQEMILPLSMKSSFSCFPLAMTSRPVRWLRGVFDEQLRGRSAPTASTSAAAASRSRRSPTPPAPSAARPPSPPVRESRAALPRRVSGAPALCAARRS